MVLDTRIPLAGRPVNFLAAYGGGQEVRQRGQMNELAMQGQRRQMNMDTAKMLAQGVLNSANKPEAYRAAIQQAGQMGADVSAFPAEYGPQAEAAMQMVAVADNPSALDALRKRYMNVGGELVDLAAEGGPAVTLKGRDKSRFKTFETPDGYFKFDKVTGDITEMRAPTPGGGTPLRTPDDPTVIEEKEAAKVLGKEKAGKVDAARKAVAAADDTIALLDALEAHPGFDGLYGASEIPVIGGVVPDRVLPDMPGGETAGARSLFEQLRGKTFLQAYETLKGGGPITDVEGKKAEGALGRFLNPDISPAEAKEAISEFKAGIRARKESAQKILAGGEAPGAAVAVPTDAVPDFKEMSDEELEAFILEMEGE